MRNRALALASLGALFMAAGASGGIAIRASDKRKDEDEPELPNMRAAPDNRRKVSKTKKAPKPQRQYFTTPDLYRRAKNSQKFQNGDTLGIPSADLERLKAAEERRKRRAAKHVS